MLPSLTIHQFPAALEMQPSPFGLKLETWLRIHKLPYEVSFSPTKMGPKGKVPFMTLGEMCLGDSELIIQMLQQKYEIADEADLSEQEQAQGVLIRRLIEDHFYFILVYSRWVDPDGWPDFRNRLFADVPALVRGMLSRKIQKKVAKYLKDQGIARHSRNEIYQMADQNLKTLSNLLGDRPYMIADHPTLTEASAYGLLANIFYPPTKGPLFTLFQKYPNLTSYCERLKNDYWREALRGGGESPKFTP